MNTKTLIAALIGGTASFLLGWLLYGILFHDTMMSMGGSAQNVMKPDSEMIMWAMILSNLIIGYLVAWIFSGWAGINTFGGGAKAGAIMGLLFSSGYDLITFATTNITTLNGTLLDIVLSTIIWTISSGLVGWWLGRGTN